MARLGRSVLWLVVALVFTIGARPQTLAHPGWVGSGMNVERWWKHAVFYEVNAGGNGAAAADDEVLRRVAAHMDDVQALGVDAIVVRNPPPVQPVGKVPAEGIPDGSSRMEAFDDLVQQASRRRLRVLIELRPSTQADLTAEARFWLNRGIAGLYLSEAAPGPSTGAPTSTPGQKEELVALRSILKGVVGERIVISDVAVDTSPGAVEADEVVGRQTRGRRGDSAKREAAARTLPTAASDPEMMLVRLADPTGDVRAETVRTSLARSIGRVQHISSTRATPLLALADDAGQHLPVTPTGDAVMGKVEAALLLGTGASAMIPGRGMTLPDSTSATEQPTTVGAQRSVNPYAAAARAARETEARAAATAVERHSLHEWYRRLNALAHGNATMRFGASTVLDHDADDVVVWVRTPKGAGPAVVLACNLSGRPVNFSLVDDLQRLHLRGSFLRTMLRSDDAMGPMSLGAVSLPPYAVYIGELRR